MKKIIIAFLTILVMGSCNEQLREEVIIEAENVSQATSPRFLLSGAITSVGKWYHTVNFEDNNQCAVAQYYQSLFAGDAQTYQEFDKASGSWDDELDLLKSIQAGVDESEAQELPSTKATFLVLKSFMFAYLTDHYGDIPYSEALRGREGILFPKFDTQSEVYAGLFADLDEAVSLLKNSSDDIDKVYDLIYNGDKSKWIKFANSLKIRLLVRSYEASNGSNGAIIQSIVNSGEYFQSVDDNASFEYDGTNEFNSWSLSNEFNSNADDELTRRKPSVTFVNTLKDLEDPRLERWIAPAYNPWANDAVADTFDVTLYGYTYTVKQQKISEDTEGKAVDYPLDDLYVGTIVGRDAAFIQYYYGATVEPAGAYDDHRLSSFSKLFHETTDPVFPVSFIQADEVNLCIAEAASKGWISGSAETFYKNGIELSLEKWGIADDEITTYLGSDAIQLDGSGDLEKIATQKWVALFTVASEAYLDFRRTRLPASLDANMPDVIRDNFPLRWRYPTAEKSNNNDSYNEAVSRQGTDDQFTKMWLLK